MLIIFLFQKHKRRLVLQWLVFSTLAIVIFMAAGAWMIQITLCHFRSSEPEVHENI
jgi:hypothetical protein